ncbi:hypothetical protein KY311_02335 [Candidatus Woesearchaeota archaeon]|nr:hypothetical protein [Candidatus Woesearchaeota archaeon]
MKQSTKSLIKGGIIAVVVYWICFGIIFLGLINSKGGWSNLGPAIAMIIATVPSSFLFLGPLEESGMGNALAVTLLILIQSTVYFLIGMGIAKIYARGFPGWKEFFKLTKAKTITSLVLFVVSLLTIYWLNIRYGHNPYGFDHFITSPPVENILGIFAVPVIVLYFPLLILFSAFSEIDQLSIFIVAIPVLLYSYFLTCFIILTKRRIKARKELKKTNHA